MTTFSKKITKKKVVLAYSGGLDTSYCLQYFQNQNFKVDTVFVNCGGFTADQMKKIKEKAVQLGADAHINIDKTDEYYHKIVRFLLYGNVLKNGTYPLSVSAERIFQAMAIARYAKSVNADYVAHGSTGAGNDQIRFDLVFQTLLPEMKILTPIRDQELSREDEMAYLKNHGLECSWEKSKYSINKGLWGTSIGGAETLTSHQSLPEKAYPSALQKRGSETVELYFEKGEISGVNGKIMAPVKAIWHLHHIASAYAIGRDTHVGDTIIGIKGRVGFEAAAPLILIKAHHLLEKHLLSKWQQYWKAQLADWYGMLLHEGQYLDPVMRNIEKFLENTQAHVTGSVTVKLHPYRFELVGIESAYDLMNEKSGVYGEMNANWTGRDVRGFSKILANSMTAFQSLNHFDK